MTKQNNRANILMLTELAVLTAIVLILQLCGIAIPLPFLATPVSLVLLPIVPLQTSIKSTNTVYGI